MRQIAEILFRPMSANLTFNEKKKESRNKTKNKRNENDLRLDQRPNAAKNVTDERTNELGSKVKSQNCKINPNRL